MNRLLIYVILAVLAVGCRNSFPDKSVTSCRYARNFDVVTVKSGNGDEAKAVVTISPHDGSRDTLLVKRPLGNVICMSSSHVACLSQIGMDSVITAVSGLDYISDPDILARLHASDRPVYDIGYDSSLDYERILSLNPDLLVTYTVSSAEPPYMSKLRSLGVPVLVIHDHLEDHPLARAEYMRLFGVLTGCSDHADTVFDNIEKRYLSMLKTVQPESKVKVLMNIPYADAWYVPGNENYMSHLVRDAGGEVLGAVKGMAASSVISIEKAFMLSQDADVWLNPGHCSTRDELAGVHHLFPSFGPVKNDLPIYNNTLKMTLKGGNDFWESGAVRPDLVLEDLIAIFRDIPSAFHEAVRDSSEPVTDIQEHSFHYFRPLD